MSLIIGNNIVGGSNNIIVTGTMLPVWILVGGIWNDAGAWDDTALWID